MSKKNMMRLFGFITILSLVLTACGGTATNEAAATETSIKPIATFSKNESVFTWGIYEFAATNLTSVIGKKTDDDFDVLLLTIGGTEYTLKTRIYEDNAGDTHLWIGFHRIDKDGNTKEVYSCYQNTGHDDMLLDTTYVNIGLIEIGEQIYVHCDVQNDGTLYIWYSPINPDLFYADMQTGTPPTNGILVATPALTTLVPSATTTLQLQATTGTPPTATATMRGDKCPFVDDNVYDVQLDYMPAEQVVIVTSTNCRIFHPGGEEEYGIYLGEVDGRERWRFIALEVEQEYGTVPGLKIKSKFISDLDGCWVIKEALGFTYLQCKLLPPEPTSTQARRTPIATATATPKK